MSNPFDFTPKSPAATPPPSVGRRAVQSSPVDGYIEKALELAPEVERHRLKGRCQTVLNMKVQDVISWGQRNLEPLQRASTIQAEIAQDFGRIDAVKWLQETVEASQRKPSMLDVFKAKTPDFYEQKMVLVRREVELLLQKATKLREEYLPEVTDLHLDLVSLIACKDRFQGSEHDIVQNRIRTLTASHQTGLMLVQVLENAIGQCATFIQEIDSLLSFTIPQMKLGNYGVRQ